MKRLLYLFIASTILISCESDNNQEDIDIIVGKWYLISEYGSTSSDCEKQSNLTFNNDYSLIINTYILGINDDCIDTGITNGTWEMKETNLYTLNRTGQSVDANVIFKDNGNKLVFLDGNEENLVYVKQ
jgi:hypothetical protein